MQFVNSYKTSWFTKKKGKKTNSDFQNGPNTNEKDGL